MAMNIRARKVLYKLLNHVYALIMLGAGDRLKVPIKVCLT